MIFPELIEKLKASKTIVLTAKQQQIDIEFDVKPLDSLRQAEKDWEDKVYTNCLSNSKRALDGQVNSILIALGFKNKTKKDVPSKLTFLTNLGITAPRILAKINSVRNLLEHEFKMPSNDTVDDFLSITTMFITSTNHYMTSFTTHFTIANENEGIHVNVYHDYKNCQMNLDDQRLYDNGKHLNIARYLKGSLDRENNFKGDINENVKTIVLDNTNDEYKELIKFLIQWKQK